MSETINFERENERLKLVLKRIFRRMEIAEEKNRYRDREMEEAKEKIRLLELENHRLRQSTDLQQGANDNGSDLSKLAIAELQLGIDKILTVVGKHHKEFHTKPCIQCKVVHPEKAKTCTLWDAVKDNDVPSTRAYLTLCNSSDLEEQHFVFFTLYTPLQCASMYGFVEVTEMLLRAGAKHERAGVNGSIHHACKNGKTEIVHLLLQHGVDTNIRDKYGDTPLHIAAEYGKEDTVRYLLENNADITRKNNNNRLAIDVAILHKFSGVTRILEQHYARIH